MPGPTTGEQRTAVALSAHQPSAEQAPAEKRNASPSPSARQAHCPAAAGNCRSAAGRIIYIEAVDADGDGDAHLVLASTDSVTAPGISVIDVESELRPGRLPAVGTSVSAAGPVYRGTYGQRQIQATILHIAPDAGNRGESGG